MVQFEITTEAVAVVHLTSPTPDLRGWRCGSDYLDGFSPAIWIADAHRGDGKRFVVRADEKLTAFIELERQVLTVTFYLESIRDDSCRDQ